MTAATDTDRARQSAFWPAFAALVCGAFAMGVSPIFVRLADVGPFASAFYRVFLALPALYLWMRLEAAHAVKPDVGPRFSPMVILTGLFFGGDLIFWHVAILKTSVANATFFATTAPVWVGIFGWVFFRRRVGGAAILGLALCLAGGTALVWQSFTIAPGRLIGDAFAEVTAIFFGAYFLTVEKARESQSAARVTFAMTVIAAAALALAALWASFALDQRFWPGSFRGWAVLIALAWISHTGGQGLLSVALGSLPAMFSSLVIFLEALAAAGLGWLVLNEAVSPLQAMGGVVILFGIWIARPRGGPQPGGDPPRA